MTSARLGLILAAALVAVAFLTSSSADQQVTAPNTWTEIVITFLGAAACGAVIVAGARGRAWGAPALGLFAALTAFAALSITWSVQPDWSWFGTDQLIFYVAAFAGAAALARLAPTRWPAVVGGVAVAAAALSAWALLAKVFPASLNPYNTYGRLLEPFGYWNALGAIAAMGMPAALWAGARPAGGRVLRALSAPALALMISVVVLSYSRSALLVAVLGAGGWIAFVPLRLRATLMLAVGALGAAPIVAWMLSHHALSRDYVEPGAQDAAGHPFGLVVLAALIAITAVGFAAVHAVDHRALGAAMRRRIGIVLIGLVALVPVAGVVALAASSRGLTGEISHGWSALVNPNADVSDQSTRVLQLGSARPLYWHEALSVAEHALLKGAGELGYGISRLQYTSSGAKADQAHSYLMQTFADLGLIGLALTIALLVAWGHAAARPLTPRASWGALSGAAAAERQGLAAVAAVVLAFGVQSALDWTWYFPGVAIPALLCAGWLAGRGPLLEPVGVARRRPPISDRPGAGAAVTGLVALALVAAWVMWQPLRSAQALRAAENAGSNAQAFADARAAAGSDPLAYQPHLELSALQQHLGDRAAARAQLVTATQVQPRNPFTWYQLGTYDFGAGNARAAVAEMQRVLALDAGPDVPAFFPRSILSAAQAEITRARHAR